MLKNQPIKFRGKVRKKAREIANEFNRQYTTVREHKTDKQTRRVRRKILKHKLGTHQPFTQDHDQYAVKVDGTGRVTLRNRKFLRLLKQIPKYPPSSSPPASVSVTPTLPTHEPETGETQETLQGTTFPPTCTPSVVPDQLCDPGTYHTFPSTPAHTASHPTSPVQSVTRPTSTSASPNIPTPVVDTVPASPAPVTRPQRTRRPNTLFNPETWDLSGLEGDSPLTRRQVSDLFLLIAQKIDKGL